LASDVPAASGSEGSLRYDKIACVGIPCDRVPFGICDGEDVAFRLRVNGEGRNRDTKDCGCAFCLRLNERLRTLVNRTNLLLSTAPTLHSVRYPHVTDPPAPAAHRAGPRVHLRLPLYGERTSSMGSGWMMRDHFDSATGLTWSIRRVHQKSHQRIAR